MGRRYRTMEDQKPLPGLALNQDFAKGIRLKLIVKKCKCLNWETRRVNLCNSNVSKTWVWGRSLCKSGGEALSRWAIFAMFCKKKLF